MVTYDVFRVLEGIPRAVDNLADGFWEDISSAREAIIHAALGLVDEAAGKIAQRLPQRLHKYVKDEDVVYVAAALALERLEGWRDAVEDQLFVTEEYAYQRRDEELFRD